jgi:hypothetical protein
VADISPAAVRLYHCLREIEMEIEDAIDDAEPIEVLIERGNRSHERFKVFERTGNPDDLNDASEDEYELAKAKTKAGMLARHRQYQRIKVELGRVLGLGPGDIHPLDPVLDSDKEWKADDLGIEAWERALRLQLELTRAHMDWICWWRRPAQLRVISDVDAAP